MSTRASTAGLIAVVDALRAADVPTVVRDDGTLVIDGEIVAIEPRAMSVVTATIARGLAQPPADVVGVVLADRISNEARKELAARGWGWIDRRGHLRIWTPRLRISTDIQPTRTTSSVDRFASVFPTVGIEVALLVLTEPEQRWSVTDVAARIGRAAGGVSERLRALREAGLLDRHNRPMLPALFDELVEPWHQRAVGLGSFPPLNGPFDQLSWLGIPDDWVLTDTQAALQLGAPVIASAEGPPDFYVPQPSILDLAVSHFGPAASAPVATVRPALFAGIYTNEPSVRRSPAGFRIAHPVVVALDLAHDRARGREIVDAWNPEELGVTRVW